MFSRMLTRLRSLTFTDLAYRALKFAMSLSTAFMTWSLFKVLLNNDMPVMVVLTGSMEPGFQRGDIAAAYTADANHAMHPGDIVIYKLEGRKIPIVHRVLERRTINDSWFSCTEGTTAWVDTGDVYDMTSDTLVEACTRLAYITKGDANPVHDTFLYTTGRGYLEPRELVGKLVSYFPGLGYVTILLQEHRWLKYSMFGMLILLALAGREE